MRKRVSPMVARIAAILVLTLTGAAPGPAAARPESAGLAVRDSFRIGSAGVLCTAQVRAIDGNTPGVFDRGYSIVCRDAAAAVGQLYAVRVNRADSWAAFLARQADMLDCAAPAATPVEGIRDASMAECTRRSDMLPFRVYGVMRGRTLYVGQGLRGYDSAVVLGLRTLLADRPISGTVEVAVTEAGDPAAFARVQAGALDAQSALSEGYLRNNSGSYAEAAEFFDSLVQKSAIGTRDNRAIEYLLNQGLQQSNLANAPAAELSFVRAEELGAAKDPVHGRLLRNYRAIHQLNQRDPAAALEILNAAVVPIAEIGDAALEQGTISEALADRINRQNAAFDRIGKVDARLLPFERARVLDGQATLLRGTALRLLGRNREALAAFDSAETILHSVRGGRVASIAFLDAEALSQSALAREALGEFAGADQALTEALRLTTINYPASASMLAAKARLAAYRARRGDTTSALQLYGEVVADADQVPGALSSVRELLLPYFELLAVSKQPSAAGAMFAANQLLVRPGLAQTQAVLARELSAGDDEAARLFREAVNRSRDVARAAGDVARMTADAPPEGSDEAKSLQDMRARLAGLQQEQVSLQAKLAAYPRYRVLDARLLTLADLQKVLRPGEAFYELRVLGQDVFAMLITSDSARGFKVGVTSDELDADVARLRDSIVRIDDGKFVTAPFDLALAKRLYDVLFGPLGSLDGVRHLIYEPDGPMLQLPPNLLVTDQASIDAYTARTGKPGGDPFDFTGIAWLGRRRDVTTAVSPRAFVGVRSATPSKARLAYLGMGHNARPNLLTSFLAAKPAANDTDPCNWPLSAWNNPVSAAELYAARDALGADRSAVMVGQDFSDTAIEQRSDLDSYRILHFATHGLVTAPRPECQARPALLTSFGPGTSDGLLSFGEIYDLHIDADLVILSACDTAGMATIEATREAGVATGGNFALDGLVRAFVGAGARTVVASHWPVPDDFSATEKLILGMIEAPPGTGVATALGRAETALMDTPATSHPYYWAAFAVVGDGARPITRAN